VYELLALDPPYRSYDGNSIVSSSYVGDLVAWSMAVNAEPTLTDCTSTALASDSAIKHVVCDLTFGEEGDRWARQGSNVRGAPHGAAR
jgi:hypothetical protein